MMQGKLENFSGYKKILNLVKFGFSEGSVTDKNQWLKQKVICSSWNRLFRGVSPCHLGCEVHRVEDVKPLFLSKFLTMLVYWCLQFQIFKNKVWKWRHKLEFHIWLCCWQAPVISLLEDSCTYVLLPFFLCFRVCQAI